MMNLSLRHALNIVTHHACNLVNADELVAPHEQLSLAQEHHDVAFYEVRFETVEELFEVLEFYFFHAAVICSEQLTYKNEWVQFDVVEHHFNSFYEVVELDVGHGLGEIAAESASGLVHAEGAGGILHSRPIARRHFLVYVDLFHEEEAFFFGHV